MTTRVREGVFAGPDGDWWYHCCGTTGPYDDRGAADFAYSDHVICEH